MREMRFFTTCFVIHDVIEMVIANVSEIILMNGTMYQISCAVFLFFLSYTLQPEADFQIARPCGRHSRVSASFESARYARKQRYVRRVVHDRHTILGNVTSRGCITFSCKLYRVVERLLEDFYPLDARFIGDNKRALFNDLSIYSIVYSSEPRLESLDTRTNLREP